MRRMGTAIATVIVTLAVLMGAAPAASATGGTPPPAQVLSPPAPTGAEAVFGETQAGDIFFNRHGLDPKGAVRHADGSITPLAKTLSGRGDMGSDGRLWLSLPDGRLWAFGADGTSTQYPIVTTAGTLSTAISEVRAGVDGRIWFLDNKVYRVGSIDTDGSDAVAVPIPGDSTLGGLEHIGRGNDGRMWVTRSRGSLYAVSDGGTVTSYPAIGSPVQGLAGNPSGLYAVVGSALLRVSPTGSVTTVSLPVTRRIGGQPIASGGWIWLGGVTVISPSGRIIQYSMPVDYTVSDLQGEAFVYPDRVAVAPSLAGGLVGVVGPNLVRIANPDVGINLKVQSTVMAAKGANVLRVTATARTPGGSPLSGTYEVRIGWNRYYPDGMFIISQSTRRIGTVEVRSGAGTVDIPITPAMVRGTPNPNSLDHGNCCSIFLRTSEGVSSVINSAGYLQPSSTMQWLDRMNGRALARPMDTAGIIYWAAKMAAGTPRVTVTKSIVGSTAWRRQRVTAAYQRWLGRKPDASGLEYWQSWLTTHTTSDLDLQIGTTPAARDAGGTSTGARANHLAAALRLSSASAHGFRKQLAAGVSWSSLVRSAYFSNSAAQRRMTDLAPRSAYTPSLEAQVAEFRASRDERGPLVKALATMP